VKEAGFKCLCTKNLNQDLLKNTFGDICSYYGCNSNPTVGQFVDALKTSIIIVAFRGLCGTNCKDDGATFLNNLQSLLREPDTSSPNPSTSRCKETAHHRKYKKLKLGGGHLYDCSSVMVTQATGK
jgi:hypothetical protein